MSGDGAWGEDCVWGCVYRCDVCLERASGTLVQEFLGPRGSAPWQQVSPTRSLLVRVEGEPVSWVIWGPGISEKGLGGHQKWDRTPDDSRTHLSMRDQSTLRAEWPVFKGLL